MTKEVDTGREAYTGWQKKNKTKLVQADAKWSATWKAASEFEGKVKAANVLSHPLTRGFNGLGAKFHALVNFRYSKGSGTFRQHAATARAGRIKDYSFAKGEKKTRAATKQSVRFQFAVADSVERTGGKPLAGGDYGTDDLRKQFGLANVQSGNWVLRDVNAAKSHVEQCALGLQDMAEILKIPAKDVALKGRLSMAFGARGHGLSGASAHYEPTHRVINLTKMKGGGSLAHEFFHFMDDVVGEMETGVKSGHAVFATDIRQPQNEVQQAFAGLVETMSAGNHTLQTSMEITESESAHWKRVMERNKKTGFYGNTALKAIHDAPNISEAMSGLHRMLSDGRFGAVKDGKPGPKAKRNYTNHQQVAVAHFGGTKATYDIPGFKGSKFMVEAQKLAVINGAGYFETSKEMAARAFSSYMEDSLAKAGRKNTYLVSNANNEHPAYKMMGWKPYPEGPERKKINKSFEALFRALKKNKSLKKAGEFLGQEELRKALRSGCMLRRR